MEEAHQEDDNDSVSSSSSTTASSDGCSPTSRWEKYQTKSTRNETLKCTRLEEGESPSSSSKDDFFRSGSWLSFNSRSASSGTAAEADKDNRSSSRTSSSASLSSSRQLEYTTDELALPDAVATEASDLSIVRPVYIVTTAALPWMTGTAVNPALRAAYLALRHYHHSTQTSTDDNTLSNNSYCTVHLVIPWLISAEDRVVLYGPEWESVDCDYQEVYIQNWLKDNVRGYGFCARTTVQIHWYQARYHAALGSIFAVCDVCARLQLEEEPLNNQTAICILEEPEHLNYYRGGHWRTKFAHVTGVIHTNYCQYAAQNAKTSLAAPLVGAVSAWMVRAYCDKVIQLSATLPPCAPEKEVVCNVHGVRDEFFAQSYHRQQNNDTCDAASAQIYFLGKLLWAKGLDKLLELQHVWKERTGDFFVMDVYGSGPEEGEIQEAFQGRMIPKNIAMRGTSAVTTNRRSYSKMAKAYWRGDDVSSGGGSSCSGSRRSSQTVVALPVTFQGRVDHAALDKGRQAKNKNGCYKIFINPSVSEVLCTVTAEALAMGKFAIIPNHPSNIFFQRFPNCLQYETEYDFCRQLTYALSNEPQPLLGQQTSALTWEGATDRLLQAAAVSQREAARRDRLRPRDQRLADWHVQLGQGATGDVLRTVLGGGPVAIQSSSSSSLLHDDAAVMTPSLSPASSYGSVGSSSTCDDDDAAGNESPLPGRSVVAIQC